MWQCPSMNPGSKYPPLPLTIVAPCGLALVMIPPESTTVDVVEGNPLPFQTCTFSIAMFVFVLALCSALEKQAITVVAIARKDPVMRDEE